MKANAILRHRNKRTTDHSMPGFAIRKACRMLEEIRKIHELKRPVPYFAKGGEIIGEQPEQIIGFIGPGDVIITKPPFNALIRKNNKNG